MRFGTNNPPSRRYYSVYLFLEVIVHHPFQPSPIPSNAWSRLAFYAILFSAIMLAPMAAGSVSLGTVRVQSTIGEPLKADLSLGQLTDEEMSSIQASLAPLSVYRSAGINPNPILNNIQIGVDASTPSNVLIKFTSSNPINEPSLNMLLEIKWASGKMLRNYTLFLNPATPIIPSPSLESTVTITPVVNESTAVEPKTQYPNPQRLSVSRGDTAVGLAMSNLPASVSLDQMLQAILRNNPHAFEANNINRLRADTILNLPSAEEALTIDPTEARLSIVAQNKEFNRYRRSLAANPQKQISSGNGQISKGRIEAKVQDKTAQQRSTDQLTLSKESAAQVAAAQKAKDEQKQKADLQRNVDDLKALAQSIPGSGTGETAPAPVVVKSDTSNKNDVLQRLLSQTWVTPAAFVLLLVLAALLMARLNRRQVASVSDETAEPVESHTTGEDQNNVATVNGMSFDFSNLNLDLNEAQKPVMASAANSEDLFAQFERAQEFLFMGDRVAAKALAQQVHAQATGLLKTRAELFLAELD
ncbi:MAG: hypothetical protein RL297_437 [Pseudomonadota bacterium]|jgi:FimV-like protein